jgi:hypothetical protein
MTAFAGGAGDPPEAQVEEFKAELYRQFDALIGSAEMIVDDAAGRDRVRLEMEARARRRFPGWIARWNGDLLEVGPPTIVVSVTIGSDPPGGGAAVEGGA